MRTPILPLRLEPEIRVILARLSEAAHCSQADVVRRAVRELFERETRREEKMKKTAKRA